MAKELKYNEEAKKAMLTGLAIVFFGCLFSKRQYRL